VPALKATGDHAFVIDGFMPDEEPAPFRDYAEEHSAHFRPASDTIGDALLTVKGWIH
jgi:hypothetical protein